MLNVLWLASWYPTKISATNGDFVERHAIAVSSVVKLTVLVIVKDETLRRNEFKIDKSEDKGFVTYKVYYGKTGWGGIIEKIFSFKKYFQLQKKMYDIIEREQGKPDIVHVHVAMKAGMLARWLKRKYKLPYAVTEHWTGYYAQSHPNIFEANAVFKNINKKILREADAFFPVSNDLGDTIQKHFVSVPYHTIHNVVATDLFFFKEYAPATFRFVHPSYLNYQKNPEGIIEACKILKEKGYDFELFFIGNKDERLMLIVKEAGLDSTIFFEQMIPYGQVAEQMQGSSALLLFSRFENLPCVILEALCCGLPVISTDVGGIKEVINDANGILVQSDDLPGLVRAMEKMINNYKNYDRKKISEMAKNMYKYETIRIQYIGAYQEIIVK